MLKSMGKSKKCIFWMVTFGLMGLRMLFPPQDSCGEILFMTGKSIKQPDMHGGSRE